ncbi:hypothetical protein ACFP76_22965 [Paracoccus aerius]
MRDTMLMHRAFMLYALIISLLYASFTFFGGLILKITNSMPSVGPVDIDQALLKSPQWPLMLAFGLTGLTQLIGPLDQLERSLRGHVHRSLGIPTRIREYTRQLIVQQLDEIHHEARELEGQDQATGTIASAINKLSSNHVTRLQQWAYDEIAQTYGVEDVLAKLILLWRMIDNLRNPRWPRENVRDEMRLLVSQQLQKATAAAIYLSELLGSLPNIEPAREDDQPHRTHQEQQLITAVESMERHLFEIGAIHAVYAQRDRDYRRVGDIKIRKSLEAVFLSEGYGPPVGQLICCALVLFVGYFASISMLNQKLITEMPVNFWTKGISATYETVRTLCIFVFPVLVAIYVSSSEPGEQGLMQSLAEDETIEQGKAATWPGSGSIMAASMWAGLTSLALMILVAMLFTWLVARNSEQFTELLLGRFNATGGTPNLAYFMAFVPLSTVVAASVVTARRLHKDPEHIAAMVLVAVVAALGMLIASVVIETKTSRCFEDRPECVADHFTDMVAAFIAVMFLSQKVTSGRVPSTAVIVVVMCLSINLGTPVHAQDSPDPEGPKQLKKAQHDQDPNIGSKNSPNGGLTPSGKLNTTTNQVGSPSETTIPSDFSIVVGFRTDAAPFSYLDNTGGIPRFQGYLADLCYEIFAGSRYKVTSVPVSVSTRFERLRPDESSKESDDRTTAQVLAIAPEDMVDVLCDPVTVRYDNISRWKNGIFSPIVFATGVTYLERTGSGATITSDVQIGYVRDTTASAVAKDICENMIANDRAAKCVKETVVREKNWVRCGAENKRNSSEEKKSSGLFQRFWSRLNSRSNNNDVYYFPCAFDNHNFLIEWFCSARSNNRLFYLGDREIILRKWQDYRALNPSCTAEVNAPLFTYEPYALLITKANPDLVQFVQRRVYQIFSDTSKARAMFAATFPEYQMSSSLAYLYLLNGVDEERALNSPDCDNPIDNCIEGVIMDGPPNR